MTTTLINGWTFVTGSIDTRIVYVSDSNGDDSNFGTDRSAPLKTIKAGYNRLRDGFPDWLLLRRGDTFDQQFISLRKISGKSSQEPLLISSYGDGDRPVIDNYRGVQVLRRDGEDVSHIAVIGIDFYDSAGDPSSSKFDPQAPRGRGVQWQQSGDGLLIEDCRFRFFGAGLSLQNRSTDKAKNRVIRRCVILDSWSGTSHSQGAYLYGLDGVVIEECVFDHNGWCVSAEGRELPKESGGPTKFNHNLYVHGMNKNVTVRNCIFLRASSHGVHFRAGGVFQGNFMWGNPLQLQVGYARDNVTPNGVTCEIHDNVIMHADDINWANVRGTGMRFEVIKSGNVCRNLIFRDQGRVPNAFAIRLAGKPSAPVRNLTFENNITHDWSRTLQVDNQQHVSYASRNNRWFLPTVSSEDKSSLHDPGSVKTLDSYIGSNPDMEFFALIREQHQRNWSPALTAASINAYFSQDFQFPSSKEFEFIEGQVTVRIGDQVKTIRLVEEDPKMQRPDPPVGHERNPRWQR